MDRRRMLIAVIAVALGAGMALGSSPLATGSEPVGLSLYVTRYASASHFSWDDTCSRFIWVYAEDARGIGAGVDPAMPTDAQLEQSQAMTHSVSVSSFGSAECGTSFWSFGPIGEDDSFTTNPVTGESSLVLSLDGCDVDVTWQSAEPLPQAAGFEHVDPNVARAMGAAYLTSPAQAEGTVCGLELSSAFGSHGYRVDANAHAVFPDGV